jgi:hypothetical protein
LSDLANFFIFLHNLFDARLFGTNRKKKERKKNSDGARVEYCDSLDDWKRTYYRELCRLVSILHILADRESV